MSGSQHRDGGGKFKHLKRKTDKDDALRLAQLHLLGQLPTVTLPPTTVRQWRMKKRGAKDAPRQFAV
ncbi:MAG TPA: hypothetical protein VFE62_10395 [Gemmataceae bacterium]|nr:hypothetical protein [Gemmataceae bacterium]